MRDESRASRILCLGDSTTFGLGVNDDDTWPHQLQMILGAHRKDVQVLNAGVSGYSSLQGLAALRDTGVLFAPQLVIVTFGYNDQSTSWKGHYDIQAASDGFLLTLLKKLWEEEGSPQSPRLTPGQYFDTMREIADVCAAHGAKCLFVAWPSKTELDPPQTARIIESQAAAPYEPSSYYHLVPFIAALSGAAWIDLYPHVKDAHPLIDMVHYNADGNRRVAQAIADLVTSQELFLR
ncbi:MAG: hypothetical protein IT368_00305, partial [Candidatus Hydrogenedentes bacterium]|nr:hypothetical protein [Candidatus Hydrogenedentota bacterium]